MRLSMLSSCYAISLLSVLIGLSTAITLPTKRDASSLAVLAFPIQKESVPTPRNGLSRRESARKLQRGVLADQLTNGLVRYITDLSVGTPPQKITLAVDTGSSDIWMNEVTSSICADPNIKPQCVQYGTYDSGSSTTRVPLENSYFSINYLGGTGASGGFVKDTVTIAGQTLNDFQFAEAYSSGQALGVIGLGYEANEQQAEDTPPYPTLPETLVNNGLINLNAYSIWLNDLAATSGTILFGGVDKAKYGGKLTTLEIEKGVEPTRSPRIGVSVNSVSFKGKKVSKPFTPEIDTGAESCYLPAEITDIILTPLGVVYSDQGYSFVECDLAKSTETVDFEFGSGDTMVTISAPLSSLIYPIKDLPTPNNAQGVPLCATGINNLQNSDDPGGLGDAFLRNAYLVVDLAHDQISLAQAVYTSDSNIVEIPTKGVAAIDT